MESVHLFIIFHHQERRILKEVKGSADVKTQALRKEGSRYIHGCKKHPILHQMPVPIKGIV